MSGGSQSLEFYSSVIGEILFWDTSIKILAADTVQ